MPCAPAATMISMSKPNVPPARPNRPKPLRQPGWVVLCGLMGVSCLLIGLMMLAMIQAPSERPQVILTSLMFVGAGVVLLPIAWMKRVRRPSPTAAEQRAQEIDHHDQPPHF